MFRMTAKYMTYVYMNDVTIKIEKNKKMSINGEKKKFHSGTEISVGILSGTIQRSAKY